MLFNSYEYPFFLIILLTLYWSFGQKRIRLQNYLLLGASYIFYAWWDWRFLCLIWVITFANFVFGNKIVEAQSERQRRCFLYASIITSLGILGTFKYFNFFVDSWILAWKTLGYSWSESTAVIILPVGISFYTFQALSYTIDIYRRQLQPTKNVSEFAIYIAFFPQLVAGPIVRAKSLLPQFAVPRKWSVLQMKEGLFQIMVGFIRKVIIADTIGQYVDVVYGNSGAHSSITLLVATILYGFQIYFDFAGYSDIAIGTAKLFGFRFKPNFNLPYFATGLSEFWRRWHISLSTWLRDYLYISLGGSRYGSLRTHSNLIVTMLLGGLWHGSNWTFVLWGGIHGVALSLERAFRGRRTWCVPSPVCWALTFSVVNLGWVFFRSESIGQGIFIVKKFYAPDFNSIFIPDINIFATALAGLLIGVSFDCLLKFRTTELEKIGGQLPDPVFIGAIVLMFTSLVLFASSAQNFIYFQF